MFSIFLSLATAIYQRIKFGSTPNLLGDRDIEYSFVAANIPEEDGKILDFGSGGTPLSLIAELKGQDVTSIDLIEYETRYRSRGKFIRDDILKTKRLKNNYFDTIINCSSIEHVGLRGRYGITEEIRDGDILAMSKLRCILKKSGVMLLTIPVGKDKVIAGMHRIYGNRRLPKLIKNYSVIKSVFWIKDVENRWVEVNKKIALKTDGSNKYYGIGCFILGKQSPSGSVIKMDKRLH